MACLWPRHSTSTWAGANATALSVPCRAPSAARPWGHGYWNGCKTREVAMASSNDSAYITATRHPLPCLLFILPMLLGYEGCVLLLGGSHPELLRNGADNWLRIGLAALGVSMSWV